MSHVKGDVLEMRMPDVPADFKVPAEGMMLDGILLFGEGSKRGLAAAACWLSLLVAFKTKDIESKFDEPQVVLLLSSLLRQGSVGTGCQHLRFYSLRKPPIRRPHSMETTPTILFQCAPSWGLPQGHLKPFCGHPS